MGQNTVIIKMNWEQKIRIVPPIKIGCLNKLKSKNGSSAKRSKKRAARMKAAAKINSIQMIGELHPQVFPCIRASVKQNRPIDVVINPIKSNFSSSLSGFGTDFIVRLIPKTAIGRLHQNDHLQERSSVKRPPINGPTERNREPTATMIPTALPRCFKGKAWIKIDMAAGDIIAPPIPWIARLITSHHPACANPPEIEAHA